jgi:hypothetical protein
MGDWLYVLIGCTCFPEQRIRKEVVMVGQESGGRRDWVREEFGVPPSSPV